VERRTVTLLRVLIADDERPAREKIRRMLARHGDVGPVFEAATGAAALQLIADERPDLVFLDIQMPGLTGLEVLRSLPGDTAPHVVFVTAYDQYAVEAFDLAAADYLLKPYDRERFDRAVERVRATLHTRERREDLERALRVLMAGGMAGRDERTERLVVEDGGRTVFVAVGDIERLEADRNYVVVHVPPRRHRMRGTISAIESRLDPRRFLRVARGLVVNADFIVEMVPAGHGDADVLLRSGGRVRLSRRYRDRLDALRATVR
jgi:two-component system LytT family response regulator